MMRRCMALLALTGAAAVACDFPTEPPMWEQTWVVPGATIDVSVAQLLPSGVDLNADTTAFLAEVPGASLTFSIEAMCGDACELIYGIEAPKPAFGDTLTTTTSLPAELVSATLAGGSFDMIMGHSFQFDPLRPTADSAGWDGYITVRITSGGNIVAEDSISGHNVAFPSGATLTPALAIDPVAVSGDLQIEVAIFSPEGDPTTIERSDTLGVMLAPTTAEIAQATVAASSITLDPTSTTMDFTGIEENSPVVDRIQSGALRFRVANPFSVTGTLDISFQLPTGTIQRSLAINEGEYTARVDFTGDELREILGSASVEVVVGGTVTAPGGTVTITPTQEMILENDFELVLLVGGSGEEE